LGRRGPAKRSRRLSTGLLPSGGARVRLPGGVVAIVVLASVVAIAPETVHAACGGGSFDTWLARRADRFADTVTVGRLIEDIDGDGYRREITGGRLI
jgi:hypothetical protein